MLVVSSVELPSRLMSLRRFAASLSLSPFSRGGESRDVKNMARPEGAQALRAIQEALDEGRFLPVVNYIPLPARLCRLLPTGRKNDWRGAWGVVRSPLLR